MTIDTKTLSRFTVYVAGASAVLALLSFLLFGPWVGFGACVGGLVAVLNWYGMRWIGARLLKANDRGQMIWGTLLALKMAAVLGVVWAILSTGLVDPLGFGIGMSGLVVGILAGAFHLALSGAMSGEMAPSGAESPSGEES